MDGKKTLVLGLILVLLSGLGYQIYRDYSKRQAEAVVSSQREALYLREKSRLHRKIPKLEALIEIVERSARLNRRLRSTFSPEVWKIAEDRGGSFKDYTTELKSMRRELADLERQSTELTRAYLINP